MATHSQGRGSSSVASPHSDEFEASERSSVLAANCQASDNQITEENSISPVAPSGEVGVQVPLENIVTPFLRHNSDGTVAFFAQDPLKTARASSKPVVTIKTNRNVYFDNDEISGVINIQSDSDRVFPNTMALLLCRYAAKNPNLPPREKVCTLHCTKYAVAGSLFVPIGVTKIPFSFITPENVPPSFESRWGDVLWEIRLVHQGSSTPLVTLGKFKFRKASLYYSLPGYRPTSQAERFMYFTGKTLRIEASLANDVISIGDAVDVIVSMHYDTTSGKALPIKKIKGSIMQNLYARKKAIVIMNKEIALENTVMEPKAWLADTVTNADGVTAEKKFSLKPQNVAKAGVQRVKNAQGRVTSILIAPSAVHDGERSTVWLKYEVLLRFVLVGAPDIILKLPYHQQNTRDEAEACGIEDIHERMVFPETEEPPIYASHRRMSVPAYQNLRRGSTDLGNPKHIDGVVEFEQPMLEVDDGSELLSIDQSVEQDKESFSKSAVSPARSMGSMATGGSTGLHDMPTYEELNIEEYCQRSATSSRTASRPTSRPTSRRPSTAFSPTSDRRPSTSSTLADTGKQRRPSVVMGLMELSGLGRSLPDGMNSGSTGSLPRTHSGRPAPVKQRSKSSTLVGMFRRRASSIGQGRSGVAALAAANEEDTEYKSPYFPDGRKQSEADASRVGTGVDIGSSYTSGSRRNFNINVDTPELEDDAAEVDEEIPASYGEEEASGDRGD
ncbi:hypothetical protein SARC_00648 [Sphaeroforma arctica JP610]|uniref:Uncharacterized protein n=1 Tax=Sphaeroforma arctica JP610 TaxID=667725 RepID=A0A0L0GDW0_9EUKA|nr:hypothetical protein SARC_00648 [Sphaeroforma arctica JP610]KNC87212.1 hypothetical protein SARC_00648 [Sphaeroforma arctica JP610]|eukprot:XP_014161114.1 hypothetical protein SARC_00648 [Sphaeroforma arctica JP610]